MTDLVFFWSFLSVFLPKMNKSVHTFTSLNLNSKRVLKRDRADSPGTRGPISSHPHPFPCLSGFPFMPWFQHSLPKRSGRQIVKFACRSFLIVKMLQDVAGRPGWLTSGLWKTLWLQPHFSQWSDPLDRATPRLLCSQEFPGGPCDLEGDVLHSPEHLEVKVQSGGEG